MLKNLKNRRGFKRAAAVAFSGLLALGLGLGELPTTPKAEAQLPPLPAVPQSSDFQLPQVQLPNLGDIRLPNGQRVQDALPPGSSLPGAPAPAPKGRPNNAKPAPRIGNGASINVYTKSTGRNRRYIMHVPTHYNPSRPTPVIFGFDGWRDSPENFRRYSRLHETGAAREAIRIYPESINHGWEGAPYATVRGGEDLRFVTQIIDEIDRTYNVDRRRIYATGHSNGGGMTAVVACHLPHVFAGVASVGGAYYNPVNSGCKNLPIPIFVMHDTGDTMMRYNGGTRHGGRPYLSVPRLMNSYKARNGCAPQPAIHNIPGGKRHVYRCARAETQLITNPQNHTWNRVPDASQEVWNFLKRQRL